MLAVGIRRIGLRLLTLLLALAPLAVSAEKLSVAVAANFLTTLERLKPGFEAATGHQLEISWGSTGKLHLQITRGAPYDLFLAANEVSPELLEQAGLTLTDSRFTYATGCLVLYSRTVEGLAERGESWLQSDPPGYLAIANPDVAPYGSAAREVLQQLDLWDHFQPKIVVGENVSQTFRYVISSGASAGFVARSQALTAVEQWGGSFWSVPANRYSRIEQQAVLLLPAEGNLAAAAFVAWLQGPTALAIIREQGYSLELCQ